MEYYYPLGDFICPYAIRKRKIFWKKIKFYVLPPVRGVWKIVKTHYNPKNENHRMGVFDSSNEASGCTDYNAKNLNSLQCTVAEKIKKNPQKIQFFQKLPFLVVFPDFFSNGTVLRVGVFCVVTSASRRFIRAIKHPHMMIFIFWVIMGFYNFSDPVYRG